MQPFSAIALFCEDIREEKSGQDILIGIFPDNLHMAPSPTAGAGIITKLGLYLRINLDANAAPPRQISVKLTHSDGTDFPLQGWADDTVRKAFSDSYANRMPVVGLVLKIVIAPFPIRGLGKIVAVVNVDGQDRVAGALNIILPSDATGSAQPD